MFIKTNSPDNKRASVLVVILWVLVIISSLAVSIGHRVAFAIKLSNNMRARVKAGYLAKAGINMAIAELNNDKNDFDSCYEPWADNELKFKKIILGSGPEEYSAVGYNLGDKINRNSFDVYGIIDAESRININRSDDIGRKQISELLLFSGMQEQEAELLAYTIVDYIDEDSNTVIGTQEELFFKNKPLAVKEELLTILEYFFKNRGYGDYAEAASQTFSFIEKLSRVCGGSQININTVTRDILTVVFRSFSDSDEERNLAGFVAGEIISLRDRLAIEDPAVAPFSDSSKINPPLNDPIGQALLTKAKNTGIFSYGSSGYFIINAQGRVSKARKNISVIYNRTNDPGKSNIIYWHED